VLFLACQKLSTLVESCLLKEVKDCIREIKWFRDKLHHDIGELQNLLDKFEYILNHGKDK